MSQTTVGQIVSAVQVMLPSDRIPTEEEIRDYVTRLAVGFGCSEGVRVAAINAVMAKRLVRMDTGFALVEEHRPWVHARRPEIDPFYWERFRAYLQSQEWPTGVIQGLDRTTDEILDLLGNPAEKDTWKRRGLVMGDVQSGKTATYSAMICKAADAGYPFIILLTGTIENLRRQTQERLDSAFVGRDSSEFLKKNKREIRVGVGLLDPRRNAVVFTSKSSDFRVSTMESLGLSLSALREPALVVIKKHLSILRNLRDWIRSYNAADGGSIDLPLLLIDDEADNASINTNDENTDPTKINAAIRELLALFRRSTYVGFTATPFANIFVNPDSTDEMLQDDLFPRDFIYTLQAPTNYFGPRKIFLEDTGADRHLRILGDIEDCIPTKHRSTFQVTQLPESLVDALCSFLVANAIRDLRDEGPTHRSMLVNVSQYTKVQDQVELLLHTELERIQAAIRNFSALPPAKALEDASLRRLHEVWRAQYRDCEFEWLDIQAALRNSALPVTTVAVNQRTGSRILDYRAYKDSGLRVVAVGGNSLSRGLTLEGLVISYFRRTSKMYDTLLQMGRWFGYRTGYEDLCRVWLPQEAIDWYGHISEATDELRDDLRRMRDLRRTPKDFGLKVRAHPDSLLVTARNKMRSAKEMTRLISVSGQSFESVSLPLPLEDQRRNWRAVESFVAAMLGDRAVTEVTDQGPRVWGGVPRASIVRLLRSFGVPLAADVRFQPDAIAELLDQLPAGVCDDWHVHMPSGSALTKDNLGGIELYPQVRGVSREDDLGAYVISGRSRRVGSRGVERIGLEPAEVEKARDLAYEAEKEDAGAVREPRAHNRINVADKYYRRARTRPLLLLHVIQPELIDAPEAVPTEPQKQTPDLDPVVAIGLSFPIFNDDTARSVATYKINLVKFREAYAGEDDEDDEVTEVEP